MSNFDNNINNKASEITHIFKEESNESKTIQKLIIEKKERNINLNDNLVSKINIKTPSIININNKNVKNKKEKQKGIILETSNNKSKLYKIKSKNKKIKGKKKSNCFRNMETIEEKYYNSNNLRKSDNLYKRSKDDYNLQDLDYEQAILYDNRTFMKIYWAFLVDTQIILGTFCTENYLTLFIIKLSFLVFTFQISFFLNAFFYTDEYISNAYHNNGVLDFFSGLPKSIYSLLVTMIITNLLDKLSSSKSELSAIIRRKKGNENYLHIINIALKKLRNKLIIYFFLVFCLGALFLYYVCAFCSVYHYSQKYWFIGCVESFLIDSLIAIIICIFLSLFRYLSIKRHIKYLYILTNIISAFL